MNDKKQISAISSAIIAAARMANKEVEGEDASHVFNTEIMMRGSAAVTRQAELDAISAKQNDSVWIGSDLSTAEIWGRFFPDFSDHFRETYEIAFDELTPDLELCEKCQKYSIEGEDCPTCENRRFESDHSQN